MSKFRCPKGCNFHTNSTLLMIKHSIIQHNANYKKEYIIGLVCMDKRLKQEVLKLVVQKK